MLLNAPVFWFKLIDSDTDEKFDQIVTQVTYIEISALSFTDIKI
jgi:hypothetical protein